MMNNRDEGLLNDSLGGFPCTILSSIYDQLTNVHDKTNFALVNKKHLRASNFKLGPLIGHLKKLTKLKEITEFSTNLILVSFETEVNLADVKNLYAEHGFPVLIKNKSSGAVFVYGGNFRFELIELDSNYLKNIHFPQPSSTLWLDADKISDDVRYDIILKTGMQSPHSYFEEQQFYSMVSKVLEVDRKIVSTSNLFVSHFVLHAHLLKDNGIIQSNLKKAVVTDGSRSKVYGLWGSKLRIELQGWTLSELLSLSRIYNEVYGIKTEVKKNENQYGISLSLREFCLKALPFLSPKVPFKSGRNQMDDVLLVQLQPNDNDIDTRYLHKLSLKHDQISIVIKDNDRFFLYWFSWLQCNLVELDKEKFKHLHFPKNFEVKRLTEQYITQEMLLALNAAKNGNFEKVDIINPTSRQRNSNSFFKQKIIEAMPPERNNMLSCIPF